MNSPSDTRSVLKRTVACGNWACLDVTRPERSLHTGSEASRTRAAIYHALAEALAGPVPGTEDLLLDAATVGARVLGSTACQRAALSLAEIGGEGDRFPFPRLCLFPCLPVSAGRPVALYESLHRQGCLMGQVTREVERYYRRLGLSPADGELPDHASVELALLGYLAAAEAEAREAGNSRLGARLRGEQRNFLRAHAGIWLPEVGATLAAADEPFFAAVGHLLSGFLVEELNGRKRHSRTGGQVPALRDQARCTLCGLCGGSCPLGALQVVESTTETALTLSPSRCVGCARCVPVCPEDVLTLSSDQAGAGNGNSHQILRRSLRAKCPGCGRPTVSHAELDAVFARLHPDPATQQRLSLCVECKSWIVDRESLIDLDARPAIYDRRSTTRR